MSNLFYIRAFSVVAFWLVVSVTTVDARLPKYSEASADEYPSVRPGSSTRLIVDSEMLGDRMTVDVWFPPSYNSAVAGGFPVIYVHDGQNLFDPMLSFSTVAWELDYIAAKLADNGKITVPIIVGIHNRGNKNLRPNDYFPEKALAYFGEDNKDTSLIWNTCAAGFFGDEHAAFVATELKPLIDYLYNTNPDRNHTFTMGSSMGALASLYLMCEYPDIFGGAACMSTHWIGSFCMNSDYTLQADPVCALGLLDYIDENLPDPLQRKLYFDQGTTGWDADYLNYESKARAIAVKHGYNEEDGTLMTFDAIGDGHNEWYWQQRVDNPLIYLLNSLSSGFIEVGVDCDSSSIPIFDLQGRIVSDRNAGGVYIINGKKIIFGN
ncbi:MAG: alpha/beta hydrolase [Muribaculaceae bacterium]|nr:alpha/beta hydrolase [Muribaculaceae bacterium]